MKLTNSHREEIVEKILKDVPQENFLAQIEIYIEKEVSALRKKNGVTLELIQLGIINSYSVSRRIYCKKDNENSYRYKGKLSLTRNLVEGFTCCGNVFYYSCTGVTFQQSEDLENSPKVNELLEKHVEQRNRIEELRERIMPILRACSTRKQAVELLPEFEAYFPQEVPKVDRTLPVVGNLVADLTKQGWPAKKKSSTKAKN